MIPKEPTKETADLITDLVESDEFKEAGCAGFECPPCEHAEFDDVDIVFIVTGFGQIAGFIAGYNCKCVPNPPVKVFIRNKNPLILIARRFISTISSNTEILVS